MERHSIATLPFYGHILKWGISVVFIANALRRTPRVCVIPRAVRRRAYVRVYTALARGDSKLRFTITAKGRRDRKAPKAASHDATSACKRSRLLEAKLRSKTVSRPPKMTAQLGHFQLLTPRGNPKRVYVYSFAISRHFLCFFWMVAIRLVACTQL